MYARFLSLCSTADARQSKHIPIASQINQSLNAPLIDFRCAPIGIAASSAFESGLTIPPFIAAILHSELD